MNANRFHRAILAAALLAALAGCGGDGDGRTLTRSELVLEANSLCAVPALDLEVLENLRPPPDDVPVFRRYVAAERALLEAEDAVEHAAAQGKAEGYALRLGFARCAERHAVDS